MSQVRRLVRRMANAQGGAYSMGREPRGAMLAGPDPEYIREQQDRSRNALAERLLEVGLEVLCAKVELGKGDLGDLFANVAKASLAAAEEIYPEATETLRMTAEEYARSRE